MATANVALAVKPRAWENQRRGKQLLPDLCHPLDGSAAMLLNAEKGTSIFK
jgi:hypothetical protein